MICVINRVQQMATIWPDGAVIVQNACHFAADNNQISSPVRVEVDKVAGNTRRVYAGITIAAPVRFVWEALTDYQGLSKFIPGEP